MQRREFLTRAALVPAAGLPFLAAPSTHAAEGTLRVAHITDIHVKPGEVPERGMARALQAVQRLSPKLDFVINGGDSIMDALEADKTRVATQWKLFHTILGAENALPIRSVIGNHDIWGWFTKGAADAQDRLYGKQWAVDELQLRGRYYSFEAGAWTFIVLDSTQLNPRGGYIAYLDDPQYEWLEGELARSAGRHVCLVSHIPLLSVTSGLFLNRTEENGDLTVKRNLMHSDFLKLKPLLRRYPNVRVCLSGHTHLQDAVTYLGVNYYCDGAVSGNWWGGSFQEFAPAFAVLEFRADGSVSREMVTY